MSKSRASSIAFALVTSALTRLFGIQGASQFAPCGQTTIATALKEQKLWGDADVKRRAEIAPEGCYLAVDFVINLHTGKNIEGLDYNYSSSHNSSKLSHKFTNATLVKPNCDPVPIQLKYNSSKNLNSEAYPYLKAVESLKSTVLELIALEIKFLGVIADGEFSSQDAVQFHVEHGINFLSRIKSNRTVEYKNQKLSLNKLAELFPYQSCHYDHRVDWRSARVAVKLGDLTVDILIVYRKDKGVWKPFFLVSTFVSAFSMAELLRIWKSRWNIEVVHRFIKQNLGFQKCQCLTIMAQQNWVDAVLDAFIAIVEVRRRKNLKNWRAAQEISAEEYKNRALTEEFGNSPPILTS